MGKDKLAALAERFAGVIPTGTAEMPSQQYLDTGVVALNWATCGGWPLGRLSMVYGPEGSGKTGLAAMAALSAQKNPRINGRTLFLDLEHKANYALFERIGVMRESLQPMYTNDKDDPLTGDLALDIVESAVGEYDLIVIDSMPNLVPAVGYESDAGANAFALVARLVSRRFPILVSRLGATPTVVLVINQIRSSMSQYGRDFKPYGGHTALHSVSLMVWIRQSSITDEGFTVKATVDKNSLGIQKRETEWNIDYTTGVDHIEDLWNTAYSAGIISRSAKLTCTDGSEVNLNSDGGRGFNDAKQNIAENAELRGILEYEVSQLF